MIRKILSVWLCMCMIMTYSEIITVSAQEAETAYDELKFWYDEPAPDDDKGSTEAAASSYKALANGYVGWESYALPLGNGYMGAMLFGGTESDRIQLTENSLSSKSFGLTNFAEVYIDFNHIYDDVNAYYRDLSLDNAVASVSYTYDGVNYSREYITSYPDKVMAIKLTADTEASLTFTLRPTIPYLNDDNEDVAKKSGTVYASDNVVTVKGVYGEHGVKYEGQFAVVPVGGTISAQNDGNGDNGTVTVSNADSAVIYISIGTNYPLNDDSVYRNKSTEKLANGITDAQLTAMLGKRIAAAAEKGYDAIFKDHIADYKSYFSRVKLDLGEDVPEVTTDVLVENYKNGDYKRYLEILLFQYGRYMLICSSREDTLPSNLQGIWNRYQTPICLCGYWHNVNVQLTYWPIFSTNLTELYKSYKDYFDVMLPVLEDGSSATILEHLPENYDENGNNGWSMGTGFTPYNVHFGTYGSSTSGNACGPFTAQAFWDYYLFTQDTELLNDWVYPVIKGCANYMSRIVSLTDDGKYLVEKSGSPENHIDFTPQGTTYDQSLAYDIMDHTLKAAEILKDAGKLTEQDIKNDEVLIRLRERIDKLDPIKIGTSGQIKEFREETYYSEFGQAAHRHVSHLMSLYPGTLINEETPAWLDAARTTLPLRDSADSDWLWAFPTRACIWARCKGGNEAYSYVQRTLKTHTRNNLLTGTKGFQIDGNTGSTAAITEMLLQSHMGYIELLPALPDAWTDGSYDGLVARGAFEIGVSWANGNATEVRVTSREGNECVLKYPGIGDATVTDTDGNNVTVTRLDADSLSFATVEGGCYTISGITVPESVTPVTGLTVENTISNGTKRIPTVSWTESEDAVSYNVYYAANDASDYTLAGNTTDAEFTIDEEFEAATDRLTLSVTAVNADGRESDRVWINDNPVSPIEKTSAEITKDGKLKIIVHPSYEVDSYNLYTDGTDGELALVSNFTGTDVIVECEDPFSAAYYVAGVVGTDEVCDAEKVTIAENAAFGKTATTSIAQSGTRRPVAGITDGSYSGATMGLNANGNAIYDFFETGAVSTATPLVVEIDLGAVYTVNSVTLVECWYQKYADVANGITIETGLTNQDGTVWTEAADGVYLNTASKGGTYVSTDVSFAKTHIADKIRVTYNRASGYSYVYNVAEIMVNGIYTGDSFKKTNVALGCPVETNLYRTNSAALLSNHLVDGIFTKGASRYATNSGVTKPCVITLRLKGVYNVYALNIYERCGAWTEKGTCSDITTIELGKTNGGNVEWTKVADNQSLTAGIGDGTPLLTEFKLDDAYEADVVRITLKSTTEYAESGKTFAQSFGYSLYEIEVYGTEAGEILHIDSVEWSVNGQEATLTANGLAEAAYDCTVNYGGDDTINGSTVFVAFYDASNTLIAVNRSVINNNSVSMAFDLTTSDAPVCYKIMTWKSPTNIKPALYSYTQYIAVK